MPRFREGRESRAAHRLNRQAAEQDVTEGLPIRNWRQLPATLSAAQKPNPATADEKLRIPLPKESNLLSAQSLALLKLARRGAPDPRTRRDLDQRGDASPEKTEDDDDELPRVPHVRRWAQVGECPEPEFLAKRRRGLSVPLSFISHSPTPYMKRARVRRIDGEGQPYVEDLIIQDGEADVDGEILSAEIITDMGPPGMIVDGVGVVNAEGLVVAGGVELSQLTQRRRPPPPRKKAKGGPGRGHRKKRVGFVAIGAPLAEASNEQARRINAGIAGEEGDVVDVEMKEGGEVVVVEKVVAGVDEDEEDEEEEGEADDTGKGETKMESDEKVERESAGLLSAAAGTSIPEPTLLPPVSDTSQQAAQPLSESSELASAPELGTREAPGRPLTISEIINDTVSLPTDVDQPQIPDPEPPQTRAEEFHQQGLDKPDSPGITLEQVQPEANDPDADPSLLDTNAGVAAATSPGTGDEPAADAPPVATPSASQQASGDETGQWTPRLAPPKMSPITPAATQMESDQRVDDTADLEADKGDKQDKDVDVDMDVTVEAAPELEEKLGGGLPGIGALPGITLPGIGILAGAMDRRSGGGPEGEVKSDAVPVLQAAGSIEATVAGPVTKGEAEEELGEAKENELPPTTPAAPNGTRSSGGPR